MPLSDFLWSLRVSGSRTPAASALSDTESDDVPNELRSGAKDVVLYMVIIDILQEYTLTKQV